MLLSVDLGPWNRASTGAAATVQRGALPGDLGEADSHWIATTLRQGQKGALSCGGACAPGRIRTCDTGFRRAVLYPLSYEGGRPKGSDSRDWPGRRNMAGVRLAGGRA